MARFFIIFIISTTLMSSSFGQSVSTINGVTYFNNEKLGTGHHEISTIKKDGQSFFQVETTRDGKDKTVKLLPAPEGSFVQMSIDSSGGSQASFISQSGNMPTFAMPNIPPVVIPQFTMPNVPPVFIPEFSTPYVYVPQVAYPPMAYAGYSGAGSFAYSG